MKTPRQRDTTPRLKPATLWRSPGKQLLLLLLLLAAWPGAGVARAQSADTVGVWGLNEYDLTKVPVTAQTGVTAIAAGRFHIVALKTDGSVVAWGGVSGSTPIAAQSGVIAIAAGANHTAALKTDGSVVAWGDNAFGQTTVPIAAQSGVTAIAAGGRHTVAFKTDGSVVAWGDNAFGQTTVPIAAQSGVTAIAAGGSHTVALKTDGSVVAWGDNAFGQTTVPIAAQSGVTAIAAGMGHTVALKTDGSVVAWGMNNFGQTDVPVAAQQRVTAIAAGAWHIVALKADGTLVAWGYNFSGQVTGTPTTLEPYFETASPVTLGGRVLSGVKAIAAGGEHTVAIVLSTAPSVTVPPASQTVDRWQSASFTVVAAGFHLNYQWRKDGVDLAGETSATYRRAFVQADQAGGYTVVVSNPAGSVTSAPPAVLTVNAIVAPGSVVAWGGGGDVDQTTVPFAARAGLTAIAAGGQCRFACWGHTVALKNDGSVVAWGANGYGQTDVPVAAQSGVMAVAAGGNHTVALKSDGSVVAWGNNVSGQVTGTPTTDYPVSATATPVTLDGQVLHGVIAIAAGTGHTVALRNDGSVVAWGANGYGQVTGTPATDGTDYPYSATATPVTLGGQVLSGVIAIAAADNHTVALKNDGSVVAWGANGNGQVTGTPTTDDPHSATATPVTLGGQVLHGVIAIAAGTGHTVALKSDGSVVAWGANGYGQVTGTPTTDGTDDYPYSATATPVTLNGQVLHGMIAIAAGMGYTVALKNDGSVVAWGANGNGQVTGTPATDDPISATATPVTLGGQVLHGVTAIAAGNAYTVALVGATAPLPWLKARRSGNDIILSWPTNATGFALQSTAALVPPVTWLDSPTSAAVVGTQFALTNTPSGNGQLYRLIKP